MLNLYNTYSKTVELFKPLKDNEVTLYTCGPTVYHYAHIGNLRTYIFSDLLKRSLLYLGYKITHGMNITDVGHLTSDEDEGEDKLEVGAMREGKHPLDLAKFYTDTFHVDMKKLNILPPDKELSATATIPDQIEIIKVLEQKGFTYHDELAIYFDTSKLADYGKLSGQRLDQKKIGAREEVVVDTRKKNPQDFVLWFFLKGRYENHILHWPSPWGEGFPGWHIECSAISRKLLGQPFDIHTGGVDHIGTHHTNEIAQSESAFQMPLANYWMHGEFLLINNSRMGKSEGNLLTLDSLIDQGFDPLAFRYLCLQAHYRTQLNFTPAVLAGAATALEKLRQFMDQEDDDRKKGNDQTYREKFAQALSDDLNIPKALAIAWEMIKDNSLSISQRQGLLNEFDKVFGLELKNSAQKPLSQDILDLIEQRNQARKNQDFSESDRIREIIEQKGFEILDTKQGTKIKKKTNR